MAKRDLLKAFLEGTLTRSQLKNQDLHKMLTKGSLFKMTDHNGQESGHSFAGQPIPRDKFKELEVLAIELKLPVYNVEIIPTERKVVTREQDVEM